MTAPETYQLQHKNLIEQIQSLKARGAIKDVSVLKVLYEKGKTKDIFMFAMRIYKHEIGAEHTIREASVRMTPNMFKDLLFSGIPLDDATRG